jgi:TP901 family phage tail tape measure protein
MALGADQTAVLSIVIKAQNQATAALRSASADVSGLQATMATAGRTMMVAGAALGGALAAGLAATVGPAIQFEQTMSGVGAVSGATAVQMQQLSTLALQLGKDTVFSANEAGQAIEELAKGGVGLQDILNGAAAATVNLAAAGQVSLPQAATIAANAMNIFSISGQQMAHVADMIAGAANASSLEVGDFAYSMQYAGAYARSAGLSFDELAVAIAEMGKQGITGSAAGTQLADFLARLQPRAGLALKTMEQLGLVTKQGGNAFVDASGRLKNLADIQQILQNATGRLTDAQRAHDLQLIFGMQGQQAANILLRAGAAGYNEMAAAMGRVTATGVANARLNNLAGDLTNLSGSLETLRIQLGAGFGGGQGMPLFREMAQNINGIVGAMIAWTQAHGPLLAHLMPLVAVVGAVTAATLTLGGAFALIAATLNPVALAIAGVIVAIGGLGAAWAASADGLQRGARTTGDMLTVQAGRWASTLSGWVGRAWDAMQPMLSTLGTQITGWLNRTADTIAQGTQSWAQNLVGGINVPPGSLDTQLQSIVDGMNAWVQGDGMNAAIRLGNNLADAIVAAIVAKFNQTIASPSWWAGIWHVITTSAPFQPTGGGLIGAIAGPGITNYTTPPFAPGGALSAQIPTAPGANAVPYGSRAIIPGAADTWNRHMDAAARGVADSWQKWAAPPGAGAPAAFASIARDAALMEGAAGRAAQAAQRAASAIPPLPRSSTVAMEMAGGGVMARQMPIPLQASTTPSTPNAAFGTGNTTQVNITVNVQNGAVQISGPASGRPGLRELGVQVGEKVADALTLFARAELAAEAGAPSELPGAR